MKIDTYIKATLGALEFYFPVLGYHMRETYWDGNAYQEVGEWIAYEEKEVD